MLLKTIVVAFLATAVLGQDLPDIRQQQIREMLRQQCERNNAADKAQDVENAGKNFLECIKGLIDINTLKTEIEEAKPNGALDEVFKKYCAKTPEFKTCIHTLFDGIAPCLDSGARDQITAGKNGTDQLIDFICYKDGDRIALFIAEQGPECFTSKANDIRDCANVIKDSVTLEKAKTLTMPEKCAKFDELTSCIVTKLEGCETPTPGNMAESLFRYIRKGSPCNTA